MAAPAADRHGEGSLARASAIGRRRPSPDFPGAGATRSQSPGLPSIMSTSTQSSRSTSPLRRPRIERDPVRDLILGSEQREQSLGLLGECDALASLPEVGAELDVANGFECHVPAGAMKRPRIDRAGNGLHVREARIAQSLPRELVEEVLPFAFVDPIRGSLAEPRLEQVVEVAAVAGNRGRGIGHRLAAATSLDPPVLDAVHPLLAERRERRGPPLRARPIPAFCLLARAEPGQDLAAVLADLAPLRPGRYRASAADRATMAARATPPVEGGRAVIPMADVDASGPRLAKLRRAPLLLPVLAMVLRDRLAGPSYRWTRSLDTRWTQMLGAGGS